MRITRYGWLSLLQMLGVVLVIGFITTDTWWGTFFAALGAFAALDATEFMAVIRSRGGDTSFFKDRDEAAL